MDGEASKCINVRMRINAKVNERDTEAEMVNDPTQEEEYIS